MKRTVFFWTALLAAVVWCAAAAGALPYSLVWPGRVAPASLGAIVSGIGLGTCEADGAESGVQACPLPLSGDGADVSTGVVWAAPSSSVVDVGSQALQGMSLSPPTVTVPVTSTFVLDVLVNCGANADAASARVYFSPTLLSVISVTADLSSFPQVLLNRFDNTVGMVAYDGGSLYCHEQEDCPSGVIRVTTITFQPRQWTAPTTYVTLWGQIAWAGQLTFDGEAAGATVEIKPAYVLYLPVLVRQTD